YMFFFNDTATTEIYTLSLHDALPIFGVGDVVGDDRRLRRVGVERRLGADGRSEEHTSELQSPMYLGCRLLLEKKHFQSAEQIFLAAEFGVAVTMLSEEFPDERRGSAIASLLFFKYRGATAAFPSSLPRPFSL